MQLNDRTLVSIPTPLGFLQIEASATVVYRISFSDEIAENGDPSLSLIRETKAQLQAYFAGKLTAFNLPLHPGGTLFQNEVWKELQKIPYATTCTYLQLAKRIGNPKSIRAAAAANGKNPLAIVIPCHRVIGANGSLTGYAGGLIRKRWLLNHESRVAGASSLFDESCS
jgi:methylated-DNA-[protein]-cysteine S-methyltransferase